PYSADDIGWLVHTALADLVDSTRQEEIASWRLFHQALSDHLRPSDREQQRQQAITRALEATVPDAPEAGRSWAAADPYVRTHLATHAAGAGLLDPLLDDPSYLVAADPNRLLIALSSLSAPTARLTRAVYRNTFDQLRNC